MNNCKAEPIHGGPMIRDHLDDIVRFVRLANGSDGVAKVMLLQTAMQLIERHYDISFNEVSGSPTSDVVDVFVDDIRTGGVISKSIELAYGLKKNVAGNGGGDSGISKQYDFEIPVPSALYTLWNQQNNPTVSYILFQHIYDFIQEHTKK